MNTKLNNTLYNLQVNDLETRYTIEAVPFSVIAEWETSKVLTVKLLTLHGIEQTSRTWDVDKCCTSTPRIYQLMTDVMNSYIQTLAHARSAINEAHSAYQQRISEVES